MKTAFYMVAVLLVMSCKIVSIQEVSFNQGYQIAVCDWMILKRQNLGAFDTAGEIGADGLEVDMGGLGNRITFDNKLLDPVQRKVFLDKSEETGVAISSIAMSGFYAHSFPSREGVDKLLDDCIAGLKKAPTIAKARLQWRKADIAIGKAGVEVKEFPGAYQVTLDESDIELPDLLTDLQDRTQLTRRSIITILTGSCRLDDFKRNPQQFIELAADAINRCKRLALVDGIKYQRCILYPSDAADDMQCVGLSSSRILNNRYLYIHFYCCLYW